MKPSTDFQNEKGLFNLMIKAVYRKSQENVRNHIDFQFVANVRILDFTPRLKIMNAIRTIW